MQAFRRAGVSFLFFAPARRISWQEQLMTTVLAIDTATVNCAVYLQLDGRLAERSGAEGEKTTDLLLPSIEALLSESDITLGALDAIIVVTGPGSFTGVRLGIGVAQGLAMAQGIPLVPVSTQAVLAAGACRQFASDYWLVAQRARPGEFYLGSYRRSAESITLVHRESVLSDGSFAEVRGWLRQRNHWSGVGDGWQEQLGLAERLDLELQHCLPDTIVSPGELIKLGCEGLRGGAAVAPELLQPNYVKVDMDYRSA